MFLKKLSTVPAFALAFAAFSATPARAADDQEEERYDRARVSALAGDLFVKGPFDEEEQAVTLNYILREGDQLRTGADTFVELELPHSTFVRLAPQTAARLETIEDQVELHLVRGSTYLSQGPDAPDAAMISELGGVGTFSRTVVRFEVETGSDGYAIARVAEGSAEASCNGKFDTLTVRQSSTCNASGVRRGEWSPEKGDAFDRWSQEREKKVRTYQAPPAAVAGDYEGMQDLDGEGEWIVVEQKHYWRPYVEVSWRPYNDGYWAWRDWLGGWTWISYRPWGHVTHHYGRWIYVGRHGWVWSPAAHFGPAWVVWANFDGYLGWAPCDFWGRPVVVVSTHTYYDHYAWTFSRPHYFSHGGGNYRRVVREPRDRPFYTFAPDEIRNMRPRPLKDPRVLRPENAVVRPNDHPSRVARADGRPRVDRKVRPDRAWPTQSELPRIMEDDARRTRQIHENARVREPMAVPRRDLASRFDDNNGIPVKTRPAARIDRDDERTLDRTIEREDRIDRDGEARGAFTRDQNEHTTIDRSPNNAITRDHESTRDNAITRDQDRPAVTRDNDRRPVTRDNDRGTFTPRTNERPSQPAQAQQPRTQTPAQRPAVQPAQRPSSVQTPSRPRMTSPATQAKPQAQPQPQVKPQSKPTFTPAKPAVKPSSAPAVRRDGKKGK